MEVIRQPRLDTIAVHRQRFSLELFPAFVQVGAKRRWIAASQDDRYEAAVPRWIVGQASLVVAGSDYDAAP